MQLLCTIIDIHQKEIIQKEILHKIILIELLPICHEERLNLQNSELTHHVDIIRIPMRNQYELQLVLVKNLKELVASGCLGICLGFRERHDHIGKFFIL